jgi:antitoxin (DNA-binding transcriptional repressor) of toxin-antitoxin stability system
MNKVTTLGAAVLASCSALAGGIVLVAPTAQAAPAVASAPVVAAGLPQTGAQLAYVQRGDTVTVYRAGRALAEVTARSAAHPGGQAALVLKVKAHKTFAFRFGQFLWADSAGDHEAFYPLRKVRIAGGTTETVTIRFDKVVDGNVIWAPRRESSIGVWQVSGSKTVGAPQLLEPSYVQRDAAVSVYKAGKLVARVTAQSAVHGKGKGQVRLEVEALAKFALRPVGGKKVTFSPKTSGRLVVNYADVAAGGLTWAPHAARVAGTWGIG